MVAFMMLNACAADRNAVGNGRIHKHRYGPGRHVDLASRIDHNGIALERVPRKGLSLLAEIPATDQTMIHLTVSTEKDLYPMRSAINTMEQRAEVPNEMVSAVMVPAEPSSLTRVADPIAVTSGNTPEVEATQERKFNWLAPLALLVALAVPILGIVLRNSWLAVGGAAAGLALGLEAMRRCRDRDLAGRGFAMAAMIVGSLLLAISLIALANGSYAP